jgi:ACDE family multidrug resistance protein
MSQNKIYQNRNLQLIFGVTLLSVMGVASITPAFPTIIEELNISSTQVGLLITFFTMPGIIMAPAYGILADRYGRKRILIPCIFLFALAGTSITFVRDFNIILGLRTLQGIGAAALFPMATTIIGDIYSGRERATAMGLNASVTNASVALYPLTGGSLALLGWYYPFFLPLIAIPIGIGVLALLNNPEPKQSRKVKDYLHGAWGYMKNIRALALFAGGVLIFIFIYGSYLTYFTLYLADNFGASPLIIGLVMASKSLFTATVSSQIGNLNKRFHLTTLIVGGFVVMAFALVLFPFMPGLWFTLIPVIFFAVAQGSIGPSIQASVAGLAPIEYRAAFMSIDAMVFRIGQTVGPPLMGLVFVLFGYDAVFFVSAVIAIVTAIAAIAYKNIAGK